jgi:hypothetical protein
MGKNPSCRQACLFFLGAVSSSVAWSVLRESEHGSGIELIADIADLRQMPLKSPYHAPLLSLPVFMLRVRGK